MFEIKTNSWSVLRLKYVCIGFGLWSIIFGMGGLLIKIYYLNFMGFITMFLSGQFYQEYCRRKEEQH